MSAEPEWTERADKRGLDPLGMQNAGVVLYQSLLPGISNVTLRMRYYGYYCWVSDAYARIGATDEFTAWRSWVRRAEALYALVCSHAKGQGGVGGSEWADRRLGQNEDIIDFAEAASNDPTAVKYLRQSLGVFGGAYYSQMAEMGLFRQGDHGIPRATNVTGKAAADAFRASIGPEVEELLRNSITLARIARDDLARLAPIVPSAIPEVSSEREAYESLLFPSDGSINGDTSRAASLRLILKAAQTFGRRPDPNEIRWHLFASERFDEEVLDGQRVRWEAYHCQDLLQVAAAALLEWATDLMAEYDAGRTLAEIEEEVRTRLGGAEPGTADLRWSELREGIDPSIFDYRSVWSRLTSRRGTAELKAWDAVHLMAALDQRIIQRAELREVARRELRVRGGGRSIMSELAWIGHRSDTRVGDLVATYVIERVVRRHSWVAMQKLRRQRDYTFLFEVRDGRLVRRNGYAPVPTTPRLNPAVQFLVDVGLVDENGTTARGRAILGANA
ncbi:hypothetical protein [Microvirga splendida]|uniref:Uncharacterized protein n=1 Tax=Microvirga splendida TaxID=2795727 RepID=A0ABS0XZB4_9HYPH|nr:hypothetical protein [Microvirga splendida]MBJ6125399.1 hypothetical protein [Microvirga splendida]